MKARQIKHFLKRVPIVWTHFKGVLKEKSLKTIKSARTGDFFIVHMSTAAGQKKHKENNHWFVIFKSNLKTYEIFDSLGFTSNAYFSNIVNIMLSDRKNMKYNTTPVQSSNSSTCGLFSIVFAIHRILNLDVSLHDLLNDIFVKNTAENEYFVKHFIAGLNK